MQGYGSVVRLADYDSAARRIPEIFDQRGGVEAGHVHHVATVQASAAAGEGAGKMCAILEDQLAGAGEHYVKRVRMIKLQGRSRINLERPRSGGDGGACNFQRATGGFDRSVISEASGNRCVGGDVFQRSTGIDLKCACIDSQVAPEGKRMAANDFDGGPGAALDQRVCNGILADRDRSAGADDSIITGSWNAGRGPLASVLPIMVAAVPNLGRRNSAKGLGRTLVLPRVSVGHNHLQQFAVVGLGRRIAAGMADGGPAVAIGNLPGVAEARRYVAAAVIH